MNSNEADLKDSLQPALERRVVYVLKETVSRERSRGTSENMNLTKGELCFFMCSNKAFRNGILPQILLHLRSLRQGRLGVESLMMHICGGNIGREK